jgi:hypothetical protein
MKLLPCDLGEMAICLSKTSEKRYIRGRSYRLRFAEPFD